MADNRLEESFVAWLDEHMKCGTADQPSRVIVVMAVCERLREAPSLRKEDHLTSSGMQLKEHDGYVSCALTRCHITSPVRAFGRRSSNVGAWIGPLLAWIESQGFAAMDENERKNFLNAIESIAASRLQVINEGKPLMARYNQGTAVAVIVDILNQAQRKKRAKDVAEYLVGAKLQVKFGDEAATPKNVNTPNRDRPADFQLGNTAIEVTVNPPDSRHLQQIVDILTNTLLDIWLLVRKADREKWENAVEATVDKQIRGRVAVTDIETFVGQNVSEIAKFAPIARAKTFTELFRLYNDRWLPQSGSSGLRIVAADAAQDGITS
ncbi:MAG: DUF4928 family protein [Thermoguttaceae bacterium]